MANQNGKQGGMADREKNVLLIIASIAILALAWFLGFQKFNEKRVVVEEQNNQLEAEVNDLERKRGQQAAMEKDTSDKRGLIETMIVQYPTELRTEDVIDRYDKLEKKVKGLTVETETFNMNQIFFTSGAVLDQLVSSEAASDDANAAAPAATDTADTTEASGDGTTGVAPAAAYVGYRSDSVATFSTDYDSLKTIINFINEYSDGRMNVRTFNITAEEGSKPLRCTMTVSMYSVGGRPDTDGTEAYVSPAFNTVSTKKENLFKKK